MTCGAMILICLLADDIPASRFDDTPPDQQYQTLAAAYEAAYAAFKKANDEAKTEADFKALPSLNPRSFAPGFMALADRYPTTPAAEDALIWVCAHTFETRECEDAKRRLVRDHLQSTKFGPALGFQGHYSDYFEGTEVFFRSVLAGNPHQALQGLACYWLARHHLHKAQGVRAVQQQPGFGIYQGVDLYKNVYGADWADRLRRLDPARLEQEAATLFERVVRFYSDIPHNDKNRSPGSLGQVVASYLHEARDLAIGKPTPDFAGTDLDGQPFRLSSRRGEVVVLDFGSHFYCGTCRQMYPHMQALIERYRGRPFAVISINAEPEKEIGDLKKAWAEAGNTWPCLFDGTWEGPIQQAWNIQAFPTIYVVDAQGMIRSRNHGGRELDEVVAELLRASPQK